jgi:hypothetical protein
VCYCLVKSSVKSNDWTQEVISSKFILGCDIILNISTKCEFSELKEILESISFFCFGIN